MEPLNPGAAVKDQQDFDPRESSIEPGVFLPELAFPLSAVYPVVATINTRLHLLVIQYWIELWVYLI